MNKHKQRYAGLLYPFCLGMAGAAAVLIAGGWNGLSAGLAVALAGAGVLLGKLGAAAEQHHSRQLRDDYLRAQQLAPV